MTPNKKSQARQPCSTATMIVPIVCTRMAPAHVERPRPGSNLHPLAELLSPPLQFLPVGHGVELGHDHKRGVHGGPRVTGRDAHVNDPNGLGPASIDVLVCHRAASAQGRRCQLPATQSDSPPNCAQQRSTATYPGDHPIDHRQHAACAGLQSVGQEHASSYGSEGWGFESLRARVNCQVSGLTPHRLFMPMSLRLIYRTGATDSGIGAILDDRAATAPTVDGEGRS